MKQKIKGCVYSGSGKIDLQKIPVPTFQKLTDASVRITRILTRPLFLKILTPGRTSSIIPTLSCLCLVPGFQEGVLPCISRSVPQMGRMTFSVCFGEDKRLMKVLKILTTSGLSKWVLAREKEKKN